MTFGPRVADDRIRLTDTGQVRLALRHRWRDGTTHLLFGPLELLERLAALTPRPRVNLVLYYGVRAAHDVVTLWPPATLGVGGAAKFEVESGGSKRIR